MLCEGISIRATARLLGISKDTVNKMLVDFGREACDWHDKTVRNVRCKQIQIDEIWSYVFVKEKNRHLVKKPKTLSGSIWTWVAQDAESRMVLSFLSGRRGAPATETFVDDLSRRVIGHPEIVTDGYLPYAEAVEDSFSGHADHVMLLKSENRNWDWEKLGAPVAMPDHSRAVSMSGRPPTIRPSTSYVERHNLTMRRSISRLARRTNAFSKKPENHAAALGLYMFWYNNIRFHKSVGAVPSVAAGLLDSPLEWRALAFRVDARAGRVIPAPPSAGRLKRREVSPDTTPSFLEEIEQCWWLTQSERQTVR